MSLPTGSPWRASVGAAQIRGTWKLDGREGPYPPCPRGPFMPNVEERQKAAEGRHIVSGSPSRAASRSLVMSSVPGAQQVCTRASVRALRPRDPAPPTTLPLGPAPPMAVPPLPEALPPRGPRPTPPPTTPGPARPSRPRPPPPPPPASPPPSQASLPPPARPRRPGTTARRCLTWASVARGRVPCFLGGRGGTGGGAGTQTSRDGLSRAGEGLEAAPLPPRRPRRLAPANGRRAADGLRTA